MTEVYPRACGGTQTGQKQPSASPGLSPRLRGNPPLVLIERPSGRSIPALAGEPPYEYISWAARTVYPRACGGTILGRRSRRLIEGLSPRLRGNHRQDSYIAPGWRSIPALAGEPRLRDMSLVGLGVYPRACGGTSVPSDSPLSRPGLSPRLRGNRVGPLKSLTLGRSIPALAGEPHRE